MGNVGTCRSDVVKGAIQVEAPQGSEYRCRHRGGATCSSDEGSVMDVDRRGCIVQAGLIKQPVMEGFNEFSKVV